MEARLALVPDLPDEFTGEPTPANFAIVMTRLSELEAQTRELQSKLMKAETRRAADDLEDELQGHLATIRKQSRAIGALERRLKEDDDPALSSNAEANAVCVRWKLATGKTKAVVGKARIKIVNARHGEGFAYSSEEWLPDHVTLELAVDGLASHPYEVYGKRYREGKRSNLKNDLKHWLADEYRVEECARLGYIARREGWTVEEGWPE